MIVVMPNGRATAEPPPANMFDQSQFAHFARFEDAPAQGCHPLHRVALLRSRRTGEHRAIAGLSMGGGQSLNSGSESGHVRLGWWVLVGPQHPSRPRVDLRSRRHYPETAASVGFLRRRRWTDETSMLNSTRPCGK